MANVDALFNAIADNPMATSPFWQNLFYDHIYAQNDPEQDDLLFYVANECVSHLTIYGEKSAAVHCD